LVHCGWFFTLKWILRTNVPLHVPPQ
jgi:hypothetical protein